MPTPEDRYSRDLRRHNLAARFIRHGARTDTVRRWTGFSDSSVVRIRRECGYAARKGAVRGRRGPVPRRVAPYLVSLRKRMESAALIGLCRLMGLIPERGLPDAARTYPTIPRGERLCTAFERFRVLIPDGELTLDQLARIFLRVVEGRELVLMRCAGCGTIWLMDLLGATRRRCSFCADIAKVARKEAQPPPSHAFSSGILEPDSLQGRLFP